jgi:hypothetical protein
MFKRNTHIPIISFIIPPPALNIPPNERGKPKSYMCCATALLIPSRLPFNFKNTSVLFIEICK